MKIKDATALVTGANRGIGKALVEQLIKHGARKIYATARDTNKLEELTRNFPNKVTAVRLDLLEASTLSTLASTCGDVNLVINNAGALELGSQLTASKEALMSDMLTNYFGTIGVLRELVPVLERNGGGCIANILSIVALAPMPGIGGYSASKAAAHSLTQTLRAELKSKQITVHGVYPGPVDTDMTKGFPIDKTHPIDVADSILKGIELGELNIMPDPVSDESFKLWQVDQTALETQFAKM